MHARTRARMRAQTRARAHTQPHTHAHTSTQQRRQEALDTKERDLVEALATIRSLRSDARETSATVEVEGERLHFVSVVRF